MSGYFLDSSQETVRYKNRKNVGEGELDEEVLISPSLKENQSSERERSFPKLNIYFYLVSILVTGIILSLTFCVLYYHSNIFSGSPRRSCEPLQKVEEVIIVSERTHFPSCTDNKTCHSFLDFIEKKHDGLKFNFVIGQRGELYIGAGFKCLVNSGKNTMYVKLLRSELLEPFDEDFKMCFRLSEIIDHGISCEKISPNFKIQDEKKICGVLESNKNRSYHVHDPNHGVKLIHSDFGWSFCGSYSTTKNVKQDKVITLESLPKNSCSPLKLVDEVIVDIEEPNVLVWLSPSLDEDENRQAGFEYNFIINHNLDIYVGLGFECRANSTSGNTLKIKVVTGDTYDYQLEKYFNILEEGLACGKISENFSLRVNCNITNTEYFGDCSVYSRGFKSSSITDKTKMNAKKHLPDFSTHDSKTPPEDGRYVVPSMSRYQLCQKKHFPNSTTPKPEPISTSTERPIIASDTSCIPYRKVDKVRLITEKISYSCSKNESCPSLLDTIEKDHEGLKYNFVIGPEGELYIGAGFKCIANSEENVLHVKLLVNEGSMGTFNTTMKNSSLNAVCDRLSTIMEHGLLCEKISQDYNIVREEFSFGYNSSNVLVNAKTDFTNQSVQQIGSLGVQCDSIVLEYVNRSNHLHNPDYKMRTLIPKNFEWTFCGDFSNKTNWEEYSEAKPNISEASCSPLVSINEITVTAESGLTTSCPTLSEALYYNFFIDDQKMCPGSRNWCKAENITETNSLRIGMVRNQLQELCENFWTLDSENYKLFFQILEEGRVCGKIEAKNISIKFICPGVLPRRWTLYIGYYFMSFNAQYNSREGHVIFARRLRWMRPILRQACPEVTLDSQDETDDEDETYVDPDYY